MSSFFTSDSAHNTLYFLDAWSPNNRLLINIFDLIG
jgi:hypothetical protein